MKLRITCAVYGEEAKWPLLSVRRSRSGHAEEQDGEDIGDREVPADMADAGCSDGPHDFAA
jgi:hypothetical protein